MSSLAEEIYRIQQELKTTRMITEERQKMHRRSAEGYMAKLKQQDRRETHNFEVGDLVTRHGAVGQGIILAVDEAPPRSTEPAPCSGWPSNRIAYCLFRAHEFELRKEARRLLSTYNLGEEMKPLLAEVPFSQLSYIDRAPDSWYKPPSTKAISKDRFADILEEEE